MGLLYASSVMAAVYDESLLHMQGSALGCGLSPISTRQHFTNDVDTRFFRLILKLLPNPQRRPLFLQGWAGAVGPSQALPLAVSLRSVQTILRNRGTPRCM